MALADRCLEDDGGGLQLRTGPTVGTVVMEVREPVMGERFLLGDVLVTSAQVQWRECRGWAMHLGRERERVLAAAICDAEAEAHGPLSAQVEQLCTITESRLEQAAKAEEAELSRTVVRFEELL